jgi:hypothetical protein
MEAWRQVQVGTLRLYPGVRLGQRCAELSDGWLKPVQLLMGIKLFSA